MAKEDKSNNKASPDSKQEKTKTGYLGGTENESFGFCYVCGSSISYPAIKVPAPGQEDKKTSDGQLVREVYYQYVLMHKICAFRYLWHIVSARVTKTSFLVQTSKFGAWEFRPLAWLKTIGKIWVFNKQEVESIDSVSLEITNHEDIPDDCIWDYQRQLYVPRKEKNGK